MFEKIKYLLVGFSVLILSACFNDGGAGITQNSTDVTYTTATLLGNAVNDAVATDSSPEISSNGLELYFHSNRAGEGGFDLWVSTRASEMGAWGAATNLGVIINTASNDKAPDISNDGLTLIFASDRVTDSEGSFDLWVTTRPSLVGAWTTPVNIGNVINTAFSDSGPSLSLDSLSLYFQSNNTGNNDLYVSTRASVGDSWGVPVNLGTTVNSTVSDSAPELSSDGLSLFFHSTRTGGLGSENIWVTTRTRVSNPWTDSSLVPIPVNSTSADTSPGLSNDWQTLYIASTRGGGNKDIWQVVP